MAEEAQGAANDWLETSRLKGPEGDTLFNRTRHRLRWRFPLLPIFSSEIRFADASTGQETSSTLYLFVVEDLEHNVRHFTCAIASFGESIKVAQVIAAAAPSLAQSCASQGKDQPARMIEMETADSLGQVRTNARLVFPNLVNVDTDRFVGDIDEIQHVFAKHGLSVFVRDEDYWRTVSVGRDPDVFICHDSRDKSKLVEPLAAALGIRFVNAWYDDRTLRPGDNWKERIEVGLRRCVMAVVVLSPAFLANMGWARRELRILLDLTEAELGKNILPLLVGVEWRQVVSSFPELSEREHIEVAGPGDLERVADEIQNTLIRLRVLERARHVNQFRP